MSPTWRSRTIPLLIGNHTRRFSISTRLPLPLASACVLNVSRFRHSRARFSALRSQWVAGGRLFPTQGGATSCGGCCPSPVPFIGWHRIETRHLVAGLDLHRRWASLPRHHHLRSAERLVGA